MTEKELSSSTLKMSWFRRLWWLWSYLAVFVITDIAIASWFFLQKDVNTIRDPYGWDAINAFAGRLSWASTASSAIALIGPLAASIAQSVRKINHNS